MSEEFVKLMAQYRELRRLRDKLDPPVAWVLSSDGMNIKQETKMNKHDELYLIVKTLFSKKDPDLLDRFIDLIIPPPSVLVDWVPDGWISASNPPVLKAMDVVGRKVEIMLTDGSTGHGWKLSKPDNSWYIIEKSCEIQNVIAWRDIPADVPSITTGWVPAGKPPDDCREVELLDSTYLTGFGFHPTTHWRNLNPLATTIGEWYWKNSFGLGNDINHIVISWHEIPRAMPARKLKVGDAVVITGRIVEIVKGNYPYGITFSGDDNDITWMAERNMKAVAILSSSPIS